MFTILLALQKVVLNHQTASCGEGERITNTLWSKAFLLYAMIFFHVPSSMNCLQL